MEELTKRQLELLKLLEKETAMSSGKLGKLLKVSSKTVRNEIMEINARYDAPCILSERGRGYRLCMNEELRSLLKDKEKVALHRNFLILKELLSHAQVNLYTLADSLFISESTLLKSIQVLNEIIKKRNPHIQIQRNHNMLQLNGSEEERRQASTYFLMQELEEYNFDVGNYISFFTSFDLLELKKRVLQFQRTHHIKMKDLEILSFVMHVAVMLERILQGNEILMPEDALAEHSQRKLAQEFYEDLQAWLSIHMSESEINYLACLFAGKLSSNRQGSLEEVKAFADELLKQIQYQYEIDLTEDEELRKNLQMHLLGLKNRIEHHTFLNNPLIADIRTHFPIMYDISVFAAMKIQEHFHTRLQEGEIGYLTLHFMGAVERLNAQQNKRIVVISPIGEAVNGYIRNRISSLHELSIEICEILSIFDMEKIEMYQPDLVVSLTPLAVELPYPSYVCENLLSNQDVEHIYELLKKEREEEQRHLEQFFDERLFFYDKEFESKEALISFLCEKLYKQGYAGKDYSDYILKREQIAPTAYGSLFAIPHPIEKCAYQHKICICILKKALLWNEHKVKIVFLFALSKEKNEQFDEIFTQLVALLDDIEKVKRLIKTMTLQEFLEIFTKK